MQSASLPDLPQGALSAIFSKVEAADLARLQGTSKWFSQAALLTSQLRHSFEPEQPGGLSVTEQLLLFARFAQHNLERGLKVKLLALQFPEPVEVTQLAQQALVDLIKACADGLEELHLVRPPVSSATLKAGVASCNKLTVISVRGWLVPFAVLSAGHFPDLRQLLWDASNAHQHEISPRLSTSCSQAFWEHSPHLHTIHLKGLVLLPDFSLPGSIQEARIVGCVIQGSLLFKHTRALKSVHVSGNANTSMHLFGVATPTDTKRVVPAIMKDLQGASELVNVHLDIGLPFVPGLVRKCPHMDYLAIECATPTDARAEDFHPQSIDGAAVIESDSLQKLVICGNFGFSGTLDVRCPRMKVLSFESELKRLAQVIAAVAGAYQCKAGVEEIYISRNIIGRYQGSWEILNLGETFFELVAKFPQLVAFGLDTCLEDLVLFSRCRLPELTKLRLTVSVMEWADERAEPHSARHQMTSIIQQLQVNCPKLREIYVHIPPGVQVTAVQLDAILIASRALDHCQFHSTEAPMRYPMSMYSI